MSLKPRIRSKNGTWCRTSVLMARALHPPRELPCTAWAKRQSDADRTVQPPFPPLPQETDHGALPR